MSAPALPNFTLIGAMCRKIGHPSKNNIGTTALRTVLPVIKPSEYRYVLHTK